MSNSDTIQKYYSAWEHHDWDELAAVLADGFEFSSPNNDDHIDQEAYKNKCWVGVEAIDHYDMERIIVQGDEAMAITTSHWKNGTTYRTADYFRVRDGKIAEIDSFFGFIPQQVAGISDALGGVSS